MTQNKARLLVDTLCATGTDQEIDVATLMYSQAIAIHQTDPARLAGAEAFSEVFCNEMIELLDSEKQYRIDCV